MLRDIILLRHGQTDWNAERRIQGLRDIPLNARGRSQIEATAQHLKNITTPDTPLAIWTSPQKRAHQSAEIVSFILGRELSFHSDLHEFDLGSWSGQLRADVRAGSPELWSRYIDDPHDTLFPLGESMSDIQERARRALAEILEASSARHLLLVTHGGLIRVLVMQLMSWPTSMHHQLSIGNASLTHIQLGAHARPKLMCLNSLRTVRWL